MRKHKPGYFCQTCNDHTSVFENSPNHLLHIILSILTAGWWLIVYAVIAIESTRAKPRCVKCGHVVASKPPKSEIVASRCVRVLQPGQVGYKG